VERRSRFSRAGVERGHVDAKASVVLSMLIEVNVYEKMS
jgi:hypothetical protein